MFAALKATGLASILGLSLVLGAAPALADPPPDDPGAGQKLSGRHRSCVGFIQ